MLHYKLQATQLFEYISTYPLMQGHEFEELDLKVPDVLHEIHYHWEFPPAQSKQVGLQMLHGLL